MYRKRTYTRKRKYPLVKNQLGNYIKKVVTSLEEKKSAFASDFVSASPGTSWSWVSFLAAVNAAAGVTQGTAKNQRIGERIRLQKIEFTVDIVMIPGGATNVDGAVCRMVVYHNKQANGSLPSTTDVFNTSDFRATRNSTFENRYSILKDFVHSMTVTDAEGATVYGGPHLFTTLTFYPKSPIDYTGSAGVIANILKNDFGVGYVADGASCCTIRLGCRLHWTDD